MFKQSENKLDIDTMRKLYGNTDMMMVSEMFDTYNEVVQEYTELAKTIDDKKVKKDIYNLREQTMKQFITHVRNLQNTQTP
jgi:hypothetical protein